MASHVMIVFAADVMAMLEKYGLADEVSCSISAATKDQIGLALCCVVAVFHSPLLPRCNC
jgi:hypothetical protein